MAEKMVRVVAGEVGAHTQRAPNGGTLSSQLQQAIRSDVES